MATERCDVLILGGGTGGCAAALALGESGLSVIMVERYTWVGGQLTSQAVPPDEHPWIEQCGCTRRYREYRELVRARYRLRPLAAEALADARLNPGGGWVSKLCHEPAIGHEVLQEMLAPAKAAGLKVYTRFRPVSAQVKGEAVEAVEFENIDDGSRLTVECRFVLDASETGELLPLAQIPYVLGAETQAETGEPNALPTSDPEWDNVQGITWCAAIGYDPKVDGTIDKPREYDFWRQHQPAGWPDRLLSFKMLHVERGEVIDFPLFSDHWFNLFSYRQIIEPSLYRDPEAEVMTTIMNWPQNDYYEATILDVPEEDADIRLSSARQLTLSVLYWLQTECGYPGLFLRPEITGTEDGMAQAPYIRESRRIRALRTVKEQDVAAYTNPGESLAPEMWDSVGVGAYRIDLHPSTNGRPTIDTSTLPFQIPLGSLIPVSGSNVLAAAKNIGVTHITNGCYRLHPVEWNIGESAALLAAHCLATGETPQAIYADKAKVAEVQKTCRRHGIELAWPKFGAL